MNTPAPRSAKTALFLSLLVLPGAGHWYLGRKRLGSLFAATTTIALLYPLAQLTRVVRETIESAMLTETAPQLSTALRTAWQAKGSLVVWGMFVMLILWIVAACDVYRRTKQGRTV